MTGDRDSRESTDVEPAWHERPSTLAGASVGALLVLAILFWGVSCVAQSDDSPTAPQYYLDPSNSQSATFGTSSSSSTSTTETITSTSPPVTTDIDPGDTSTTPTTPPSDTSGTDTTTSFNPSNLPRTRAPSTYDDGRTRPRFNETRTMYPRP